MSKTIVCLTHSADFYNIDIVRSEIRKHGYQSLRLNCDQFPFEIKLTHRLNRLIFDQQICIGNTTLSTEDIAAVWLRKNALPHIPLSSDNEQKFQYYNQCVQESDTAKNLILNSLETVPWIDPIYSIQKAENKGLQLQLALQAGLMIPDTLVTNSPEQVLDFYHAHNKNIVTKMLTPLSVSMGRPHNFVYTSRVQKKHLENLDGLQYSPMVFQNEVAKSFELRVAYVDGRCFTGKIDVTQCDVKTQVDWRQAQENDCQWQNFEIDNTISQSIDTLMRMLGLSFGAIDFIVTPDNEYYFLEVNPCGEWGMLQKYLDLPIGEHIARALIRKSESQEKRQIDRGEPCLNL